MFSSYEQVHELPPDKLKIREIVHIDISNDPVASADYKEDEDPSKFKSQKTGRGPLVGKDWKHNVQPVMTCYKLVTCEFKWFGLQTRVEGFIQKAERRLFTNFHRQVFCWIDRWYGLTMEDIRAIEDNTKEELDRVSNLIQFFFLFSVSNLIDFFALCEAFLLEGSSLFKKKCQPFEILFICCNCSKDIKVKYGVCELMIEASIASIMNG